MVRVHVAVVCPTCRQAWGAGLPWRLACHGRGWFLGVALRPRDRYGFRHGRRWTWFAKPSPGPVDRH